MNNTDLINEAKPILKKFQHNWFLSISLFILTFFSTTFMGALWFGVENSKPLITYKDLIFQLTSLEFLLRGVRFSIPLLIILLAHELGHYFACRYYRVGATLPFFIPVPVGVGTFGAFIKIKEPIPTKRILFDIGVAGPLSGFLVLIPFAFYGIWTSEVAPLVEEEGVMVLQDPLFFKILLFLKFGTLENQAVLLNPFIFASWIGILATMLNLLPFGQLDGGHIIYALLGKYQRKIIFPLYIILLILGIKWLPWFLWAGIIFIMGPFHPPLWDENLPIGRKRKIFGIIILFIFIFSFMPVPVKFN